MDFDDRQEAQVQVIAGDWKTQLPQESRERILIKIVETLKRHVPFSGEEGLQELKKIAQRFEETIYDSATSQSDYLRKISLKMLTMETQSHNPQDPASQSMQSQLQQQFLSLNIQNNIPSTGMPNTVGNSMGQGATPNYTHANSQRQQQQVVSRDSLQQPLNPQQYLHMQQMQQQLTRQQYIMHHHQQQQQQEQQQRQQTGNASSGDWQEEVYQKIKSMHEVYYPELNEMYQRMAAKLQQDEALPQQPKNERLEKLRFLMLMLERLIMFLRTNKNDIQPNHKEKIVGVENQIVNILKPNRPRKPVSSLQQGQLSQPHMHAMQESQQQTTASNEFSE
ncbi:mediator of RNA polymerase II transcription subunit 15a-like protein, partial [Perilla frutescens var. frutescens]